MHTRALHGLCSCCPGCIAAVAAAAQGPLPMHCHAMNMLCCAILASLVRELAALTGCRGKRKKACANARCDRRD
eukprot:4339707-Alexandrium_andersonii.AAC.1